jgi:hypothetical protein
VPSADGSEGGLEAAPSTRSMESTVSCLSLASVRSDLMFPGCGKTQLAHTMCVTAQLPKDMGGAEGKVAFIGMSSGFF